MKRIDWPPGPSFLSWVRGGAWNVVLVVLILGLTILFGYLALMAFSQICLLLWNVGVKVWGFITWGWEIVSELGILAIILVAWLLYWLWGRFWLRRNFEITTRRIDLVEAETCRIDELSEKLRSMADKHDMLIDEVGYLKSKTQQLAFMVQRINSETD